jgi:hypothetical protein
MNTIDRPLPHWATAGTNIIKASNLTIAQSYNPPKNEKSTQAVKIHPPH